MLYPEIYYYFYPLQVLTVLVCVMILLLVVHFVIMARVASLRNRMNKLRDEALKILDDAKVEVEKYRTDVKLEGEDAVMSKELFSDVMTDLVMEHEEMGGCPHSFLCSVYKNGYELINLDKVPLTNEHRLNKHLFDETGKIKPAFNIRVIRNVGWGMMKKATEIMMITDSAHAIFETMRDKFPVKDSKDDAKLAEKDTEQQKKTAPRKPAKKVVTKKATKKVAKKKVTKTS